MSTRAALASSLLLLLATACSAPAVTDDSFNDPAGGEEDGKSPARPGEPNGGTPGTGSEAIDLGTEAAGTALTFDVPAGTLGFSITVDAPVTDDDFLGVQELKDPSGAIVIADFEGKTDEGRNLLSSSGTGIGVVRVPLVGDHAADPVKAGRWTVKLGGAKRVPGAAKGTTTPLSGRMHGAVRMQTSTDGTFRGGMLDLDIYVPDTLVVGGGGKGSASRTITAATAANDPALKERIDLAFGMFQRLYGVDRGDVRYHAIAASIASISGQAEIDAANIVANKGGTRPAAQIVLTNMLDADGYGEGEISGISNCLPGAVGVPGTKCSAVIVSLRDGGVAWEDASTLVHELGHFVGLEHTTELDGGGDTLADTPECTISGKGSLASCPDHNNLMFPTSNLANDEPSIGVSNTQRAIFRSSPLYRAKR